MQKAATGRKQQQQQRAKQNSKAEAKQKTAKRVKKGSTPASEKHEGQAEAPSFSKSGRLLKKKQAY